MPTDVLAELSWRGLIAQHSDVAADRLVTLYCGFDPTADSLHVGSLVPLLTLRRFQLAGHRPIALVGGGTGLIGDPSGKTAERTLNPEETVRAWTEAIRGQVTRFLDLEGGGALLADNYEWIGATSTIEFLRDVGKHFTVNYMLAKESVAARIEGEGISFTEFSYMLLQAYDYLRLYERYGCTLQVGGSDQWGNITAGIELVRRIHGVRVQGLTVPLVTSPSGTKFGKTEAGTVWLDPARTSPYAFYQFWRNADDRDVPGYLRYFSFRSREEIEALDVAVRDRPQAREAQRTLAREMTALVHGEEALRAAEQASEALFGAAPIRSLDLRQLEWAVAGAPVAAYADAAALPPLPNLLVQAGLCQTTSEARAAIGQGGVYVNDERVADPAYRPGEADLLHRRYVVLRRGKRTYGVAVVGR